MKQSRESEITKANKWIAIIFTTISNLIIAILANFLTSFLNDGMFLMAFSPVRLWGIVIIIIVGIILAVGLLIWNKKLKISRKMLYCIFCVYSVLIIFAYMLNTIICCNSCLKQGRTDAETIIKVINAESEAVVHKDISTIEAIFDKNALIIDAANKRVWENPISRYETLFVNATFIKASHSEIQPKKINLLRNTAIFFSGSSGAYVRKDNPNSIIKYNNPAGSNEWTLIKNNCGCWVIKEFRFNLPVK